MASLSGSFRQTAADAAVDQQRPARSETIQNRRMARTSGVTCSGFDERVEPGSGRGSEQERLAVDDLDGPDRVVRVVQVAVVGHGAVQRLVQHEAEQAALEVARQTEHQVAVEVADQRPVERQGAGRGARETQTRDGQRLAPALRDLQLLQHERRLVGLVDQADVATGRRGGGSGENQGESSEGEHAHGGPPAPLYHRAIAGSLPGSASSARSASVATSSAMRSASPSTPRNQVSVASSSPNRARAASAASTGAKSPARTPARIQPSTAATSRSRSRQKPRKRGACSSGSTARAPTS